MTNRYPALTTDSLATIAIAFYILSSSPAPLIDALMRFDDESLTNTLIDELNENELIFDAFYDPTTRAAEFDESIDAAAAIMNSDDFRAIILTAFADARARIMIDDDPYDSRDDD